MTKKMTLPEELRLYAEEDCEVSTRKDFILRVADDVERLNNEIESLKRDKSEYREALEAIAGADRLDFAQGTAKSALDWWDMDQSPPEPEGQS